jgi:hypothetical protein
VCISSLVGTTAAAAARAERATPRRMTAPKSRRGSGAVIRFPKRSVSELVPKWRAQGLGGPLLTFSALM